MRSPPFTAVGPLSGCEHKQLLGTHQEYPKWETVPPRARPVCLEHVSSRFTMEYNFGNGIITEILKFQMIYALQIDKTFLVAIALQLMISDGTK